MTAKTLKTAIRENVDRRARLMTDEDKQYQGIGAEYASRDTVKHTAGEYLRGDVTTNTVEGCFSILKRGLNGVYHSVSKKHLHRYLAEYAFRYNNRRLSDGNRTVAAIKAAEGRRIRYQEPVS